MIKLNEIFFYETDHCPLCGRDKQDVIGLYKTLKFGADLSNEDIIYYLCKICGTRFRRPKK